MVIFNINFVILFHSIPINENEHFMFVFPLGLICIYSTNF